MCKRKREKTRKKERKKERKETQITVLYRSINSSTVMIKKILVSLSKKIPPVLFIFRHFSLPKVLV
jgi:hypothetical protein